MSSSNCQTYLGDSVYVRIIDPSTPTTVVLTTENGYPDDPRNKIILEPEVIQAFLDYLIDQKIISKKTHG